MAKAKKIDAVTIIGLLLAVLILVGGNYYITSKRAAELRAWQLAQDAEAERRRIELEKNPPPAVEKIVPNGEAQPVAPKEQQPPPPVQADSEPGDPGDIAVGGPQAKLKLTFTARGAALKSAVLADQFSDPATKKVKGVETLAEIEAGKRTFGLPIFEIGPPEAERQSERTAFDQAAGPLRKLDQRMWKLDSNSGGFDAQGNWTLAYSTVLNQKFTVVKTFTVNQNTYHLFADIAVTNNSGAPVSFSYGLHGPAGILLDGPPDNPKGGAFVAIIAELAGRAAPPEGRAPEEPTIRQVDPGTAENGAEEKRSISMEQNLWGTVKNRFYMSALISADPKQTIKLRTIPIKHDPNAADKRYAEPNLGVLALRRTSPALENGKSSAADRYALYIGPSNEGELATTADLIAPKGALYLEDAVHYCDIFGWRWPRVDWIARKMMWLFQRLYDLFGSYGLSVILLTLVIKSALHPMQRKMMVSMNKMQKLQPELKKIQEKYKGQTSTEARQKMMLEQQDLMRKAGASPVAGCLPMFLQIPIFSALYGIFNRAFEIRGAEFLWIKDLSQQDHLASLPFWPHELNLLPLIYMAVTILQTRVMPTPKSDDPQQEMNRKMMQFMPIMFSLLFYRMPAGLVLYFAVSAIYGMGESWYIKNYLIKDPQPPSPGAAAASGKPPPAVVPAKS